MQTHKFADIKFRNSKCYYCLGCQRLEDPNFPGDKFCRHFEKDFTERPKQPKKEPERKFIQLSIGV